MFCAKESDSGKELGSVALGESSRPATVALARQPGPPSVPHKLWLLRSVVFLAAKAVQPRTRTAQGRGEDIVMAGRRGMIRKTGRAEIGLSRVVSPSAALNHLR